MKQYILRGVGILGMFAFAVFEKSNQALAAVTPPPVCVNCWFPSGVNLPDQSIYGIIANIAVWLLMILGFAAIISFIVAGLFYFLAAGDEKQMATAKNALKYSIYGVITALLGYIILVAASNMLDGSIAF